VNFINKLPLFFSDILPFWTKQVSRYSEKMQEHYGKDELQVSHGNKAIKILKYKYNFSNQNKKSCSGNLYPGRHSLDPDKQPLFRKTKVCLNSSKICF